MALFFNLWSRNAGSKRAGSVGGIAQRFLQVFLDHGVEASQIPRFLPQIKLEDVSSPEKLLSALTPEIIDQTAQLFGIRSQWLEGVDDEIYDYQYCSKEPELLLEHLATLNPDPKNRPRFPLRILSTSKHLDPNAPREQLLAPVLVEEIAELGEKNIYRYHIYRDGFNWSYQPSRIEIKSIARLVCKAFNIPVPLFVISPGDMEDILEGRLIPAKYLGGCQITNPSLEDYALSPDESVVAKEVEELPDVLRYIQERNLHNFSFSRPIEFQPEVVTPQNPVESSIPIAPQESPNMFGKRARAKAAIWEPIRHSAEVLWVQNDQLSIADVISDLKKMPQLKASVLSESAVRKHIADLAPPGISGKPGRKPNKSP